MKGFTTLKQYLIESNASRLSKEEIDSLKIKYRKLYFKEYNRRRKKPVTLTLRMKKEDYNRIRSAQQDYKYRSLNKFITDSVLAYLENQYVFPEEESKQQLINELNSIGTNINQVVHKLHLHTLRMQASSGTIETSEENLSRILAGYKLLKDEVDQLKFKVLTFIQTPQPALIGLSWNKISRDKKKLNVLISHLEDHLKKL